MSSPAGLTTKQSRGVRSKEEILDAAERLMGARGYAATSISALAAASGLPPSSIYWHFGSKSGLLSAVMERGAQRFLAAGTLGAQDQPGEPRTRLRLMIETTVGNIPAHAPYLRLFVLLLLGVEGDHSQQHVTARVRASGRHLLGLGLAWAYEPWGEAAAQDAREHLTDLTLALLDGIFMACEATGTVPEGLVDRAVRAVHALAQQRHPDADRAARSG